MHPHMPEHYTIGEVFQRARRQQPCLLVFEDLDSLVTDENRSVFLNELDGLVVNTGILVVASTNHPERLDPALRDRPSRFDRTWHFQLPELPERTAFLESWRDRAEAGRHLDPAEIPSIATATAGFSFAYLKELMISSLMRWIDGDPNEPLVTTVERQIVVLREQIAESASPSTHESDRGECDDEDG